MQEFRTLSPIEKKQKKKANKQTTHGRLILAKRNLHVVLESVI